MISSLDILYSSKTDQIMSRYRPIAPKPQIPPNPLLDGTNDKQMQHPFFTNLCSYETRPTRSRKRTRTCNPTTTTTTHKRPKIHLTQASSLAEKIQIPLLLQGPGHGLPIFLSNPTSTFQEGLPGCGRDLVTLSLLQDIRTIRAPPSPVPESSTDIAGSNLFRKVEEGVLDLNCKPEVSEETDMLQKLQVVLPFAPMTCGPVIVPQPIRPIGSSISVGCISETAASGSTALVTKKPEEVEEEVESQTLPSVVSDSNNKVRLANSAYKELVGQPECPWLDSMIAKDGKAGATTMPKRISGEVILDLSDSSVPISSSNGFSCKAKIEWDSNGQKTFINAPCNVIRLSCESRNYLFTWRFLIPKSKAW